MWTREDLALLSLVALSAAGILWVEHRKRMDRRLRGLVLVRPSYRLPFLPS